MTLTQIEDEIRTLRAAERIKLYKWLDHIVVADCGEDTSPEISAFPMRRSEFSAWSGKSPENGVISV
jgi:hypothetical protein